MPILHIFILSNLKLKSFDLFIHLYLLFGIIPCISLWYFCCGNTDLHCTDVGTLISVFIIVCLTGSLICKIISMCWVTCLTITQGVTHLRWSAYIRANSLLIFLSEAIWLVGRGSVTVLKICCHLACALVPTTFKAETSPLGIYFTVFIGMCLCFSDFDAFLTG